MVMPKTKELRDLMDNRLEAAIRALEKKGVDVRGKSPKEIKKMVREAEKKKPR